MIQEVSSRSRVRNIERSGYSNFKEERSLRCMVSTDEERVLQGGWMTGLTDGQRSKMQVAFIIKTLNK